ncbi:unnamed protein product [Aspergillus niger]|nr:unnamed protein product [Aspergillus niger]
MDNLRQEVDDLVTMSENAFTNKHFDMLLTREEVYRYGNSANLITLASDQADICQELYDFYRSSASFIINLEFDIFSDWEGVQRAPAPSTVSPREWVQSELRLLNAEDHTTRPKAIAAAAVRKSEKLVFNMFIAQHEMTCRRVQISQINDEDVSYAGCHATLAAAFNQLLRASNDGSTRRCQCFSRDPVSPRFKMVEYVSGNRADYVDTMTPLRQILSGSHGHSEREEIFSPTTKAKVAIDIAVTGLIFLKSSWYTELCSCHLRCEQLCDGGYFHCCLRVGPIEHVPPLWGRDSHGCWCNTVPGMHLRRIGLLLVEVAVGRPILDATVTGSSMLLRYAIKDPPNMNHGDIDSISDNVFLATHSVPYQNAVKYCLRSSLQPTDIGRSASRDDFQEYFDNVVAP